MRRIRGGFRLLGQSAQVVRAEPRLIGVIFIGFVVTSAAFVAFFFAAFGRAPQLEDFRFPRMLWVLPVLYVAWLPGSLAGATVVATAMQRLEGRDPSIRKGFQLALARIPQLVMFTLLAIGVGLVIQLIVEKLKVGGRLAALVVGASWTVVTMLVIPVILFENANAFEAVKRSGSLVKERWGEGVTGQASLGIALAVAMVSVMILGGMVVPFNLAAGVTVIVAAVLIGMTVSTALGSVFQTALYRYAVDGTVSAPFTRSQLDDAFESKEDRRKASPARKALRIFSLVMIIVYVGLRILRSQLGN